MVNDILEKTNIPPDAELHYEKHWEEFKRKTGKMSSNAGKAVKRLRTIADRLDQTWREHKMKYVAATFAFVVGGVITISTGSVAAMGFGIAGAVMTMRADTIKNAKDLEDKKLAEKLLKETKDNFIAVRKIIHDWSDEKEYERMIYIYRLAEFHKVVNPQVLMILRTSIFESMGIPSMVKEAVTFLGKALWNSGSKAAVQGGAEGAAKAGVQAAEDALQAGAKTSAEEVAKSGAQVGYDPANAGWKTVGNSQKNLITVINTAFLVLDTIELGFTIMELLENKGCDAAKDLREKAKEIEDAFKR